MASTDATRSLLLSRRSSRTRGETASYIGKMSRTHEDDASDHVADKPDSSEPAEQVKPEDGEGPFPPLAGQPRPPIGN